MCIMKTSTEIGSLSKFMGYEKAVEAVAKAGFDAFDLSMFDMARYDWSAGKVIDNASPFNGSDYLKFARRLKQIGLDNGIVCNQSHAPFPSDIPEIASYFKRAIECTAEAGGNICIIHPVNHHSAEKNAEMYNNLLPFAKDYGVKIATENMWNWNNETNCAAPAACSSHQDFLKHIEAVNDPYLVACLDIGHAEMKGLETSSVEMIKTLGGHLQALHIHDNDMWHDDHQIPFSMKINYEPIVKALKEINYSGYFTLEADAFLGSLPESEKEKNISVLAASARKLADMFDAL